MYQKYVIASAKGEPMLYMRLSKALYGLLHSASLLYEKLRTNFKDFGFEVNPYDPCVANKTVNRSQMTVTWQVDDLKISHKDSLEATKFIDHFEIAVDSKQRTFPGYVKSDWSSSSVVTVGDDQSDLT